MNINHEATRAGRARIELPPRRDYRTHRLDTAPGGRPVRRLPPHQSSRPAASSRRDFAPPITSRRWPRLVCDALIVGGSLAYLGLMLWITGELI